MRKKFTFWHSLVGLVALSGFEAFAIEVLMGSGYEPWIVVLAAVIGGGANLYVTMEVIEEVRNARRMFLFLSAVLCEFLLFFTLQYAYLLIVEPSSFPVLTLDPITLLLHSTMIFAFNPLYLPATEAGRALMLVNTVGSLGLVLFVLQNISQFRRLHN